MPPTFAFGREIITLHPTVSLADLGWVLLASVLVSVLASLQPAWRASRMDPIKALHHV
jgi:putative ABC transport system permease protein